MRGTDATLTMTGGQFIERATDDKHAMDLVQAHLIETLSSVGRESVDIYFLRIRRALEENQINGALEALELAKQEGNVKYIGIFADGPGLAVLGQWQFHDAFETILIPRNHYNSQTYDQLAPMAKERRVGVVTSQPLEWDFGVRFTDLPELWRFKNLTQSFYGHSLNQAVLHDLAKDHPVLVTARTPAEIREAVAAPQIQAPEGLEAMIAEYKAAFDDDATWANLADHPAAALRQAAQKRLATQEAF